MLLYQTKLLDIISDDPKVLGSQLLNIYFASLDYILIMSEDIPYALNSVQATNFMPLWGRAKYSGDNPDLLQDPVAVDLMHKIQQEYHLDYSLIEKTHKNRVEYFGMIFWPGDATWMMP